MDPLTPNKIQRLMHLAEDSSFNMPSKRVLLSEEDLKHLYPGGPMPYKKESGACESSSGLLDLDNLQGFGESDPGSIGKTTGFFPGEMTGRSTGTSESILQHRHSYNSVEALTKEVNKQTNEVQDLMRHSIATNYSFHSKNLTAEEASFVRKNAPLPLQQTHTLFQETSSSVNASAMSIGGYFGSRCPELEKVLTQTERTNNFSMEPSLTEVSTHIEPAEHKQYYKTDPSLDSIPVRQPRNPMSDQLLEQAYSKLPPPKKEPFKVPNATPAGNNATKIEPQKYIKPNPTPDLRKTMSAGKGNDLFIKAVTKSSMQAISEDNEGSLMDSSLTLSKIADVLGNYDFQGSQSIIDVSDVMDRINRKQQSKQPLSELNSAPKQEMPVTYLVNTRDMELAASAGSVQTVIEVDKFNVNQENKMIPDVIVTRHSLTKNNLNAGSESVKTENTRSKSSSTRSRSTLSTVQENYGPESPLHSSRGEVNTSHVPSPHIEYKELDKSVDWREVMQQKYIKQQGLAKEVWAEITAEPVNGFVGVSCIATISVVTLTDTWVTATFYFDTLPNQGRDLRIDLPRQPLLLSPHKTEQTQIHITCSAEMKAVLPFTITLKDSNIDAEKDHKGSLEVDFKMPVVQAMSLDGLNKVNFPPTLANTLVKRTFVLFSDSPVDLQLSLSLVSSQSIFAIRSVQEIRKSEVNKVLNEYKGTTDEREPLSNLKNKSVNKQLCRLSRGNAIKVTVTFAARFPSNQMSTKKIGTLATLTDAIFVNLIGVEKIVQKVEMIGTVGTASLAFNAVEIFLMKEKQLLQVCNNGSVSAVWFVSLSDEKNVFSVNKRRLELAPGETDSLGLSYTGPEQPLTTATLIFEEAVTDAKTILEIHGGAKKPKYFPIKTSSQVVSWIRGGRKEISLKNATDQKIQIRCQILGDAFAIDLPGVDARGSCIIQFTPNETRPLPILYAPTTQIPHVATLHLIFDKNNEFSRKISLYGCSSGDTLRWCGLATYGETALVRAVARNDIQLKLTNKSPMPAFVCARVNFNLQYMSVAASCRLEGARKIVRGRGSHSLLLRVDWARVERRAHDARAPTLATLTALTGPALTRARILRIIRKSKGAPDPSLLPDNLKMLVEPFENEEEMNMDCLLTEFNETEVSLEELIGGLQELKAQIDLPQDIAEETIIIADETVTEHHTLFE